MIYRFAAVSVFGLGALLAGPLPADPIAFDATWKRQAFSLFSSNRYSYGGAVLGVSSDDAVSLTYREVPAALRSATQARWSWAVAEGVPGTDLTRKGGDDRNLALYFVFLPEADLAGGTGNVTRLLRNDNARVLVYVWGGAHQRGAVLPSPYLGNRGRTIVLRGAGTGRAGETVDLARDYARAFGGSAPALVGIAVSADSDDTDTRIRAEIRDLQLD